MIYNETEIIPQGDLNALEWEGVPEVDSLGARIDQAQAFRVRTKEELARVIEAAREANVILRPGGAFTSSKAFVAPPASWMEAHRKKGVWVVSFDHRGEFGEIKVDMDREEVTVGAAVSLQQMDDAVRERTVIDNGVRRPRLGNVMRITTMDASTVATALGSGGVSDAGESSISAMKGAQWVDGRGVLHNENYDPTDYFSSASSSFARVDHRRVGMEMSGRGGPFGIGTQARFKLVEAPVADFTAVFPFVGSAEEVREQLADFTVVMNRRSKELKMEQAPVQLMALELMDRAAIDVAAEGMGRRPFSFTEEPSLVVIADFAQYDWWDEGTRPWADSDALLHAFEHCLVPPAFAESVQPIFGSSGRKEVSAFRLQGPEHLRALLKKRKHEVPQVGSESTDWAVDPRDPALVQWYFEQFFRLHNQVQSAVYRQALYGHLFNRLDLHHRVVMDDPAALKAHQSRSIAFGQQVAQRQKDGERVRVRGEKVENPFDRRDSLTISRLREGAHQDSNRRLLKRVDPSGLFKDRAAERWGGRYDY